MFRHMVEFSLDIANSLKKKKSIFCNINSAEFYSRPTNAPFKPQILLSFYSLYNGFT